MHAAVGGGAALVDAAGACAMTLTLYVPAATPLHRLHPVTKLLALLGLVVAAFVVDRPELLLGLGLPLAVLLVLAGGRPPLRRFPPALGLTFALTPALGASLYCD